MHEDVGVLFERSPLLLDLDADHLRVARQRARSETEHEPPTGQVVQEDRTISYPQRVVVRQRQHTGAKLDMASLGRAVCDEDHRVGDDLRPRGVVLTDPGFLEAETIEVLDDLKIALVGADRILSGKRVEWGHENTELET